MEDEVEECNAFCLEQLRVLFITLAHHEREEVSERKMISSVLEPYAELKDL